MGSQSQVLISPCLSLLLLRSLIHKRYDGRLGQGPGMAFLSGGGTEGELGTDLLQLSCFEVYSVSMRLTVVIKKTYAIPLSAYNASCLHLCPLSFSLQKDKRKSSSCHVMFVKVDEIRTSYNSGHLGALVAQRTSILSSLLLSGDVDLAGSLSPSFPPTQVCII